MPTIERQPTDIDGKAEPERSRQKLIIHHDVEVRRAEQDHEIELRRLKEKYAFDVGILEGERNAFGLVRRRQEFEMKWRELEENHQTAVRRRADDFARQLAEIENLVDLTKEPWRGDPPEKRERNRIIWTMREERASWNAIYAELDQQKLHAAISTIKLHYKRMKGLAGKIG